MAWEPAPMEEIFANLTNEKFQNDHYCFVCGRENPYGLRVQFEINKTEEKCRTRVMIPKHLQGWTNVVHGGVLSMLLDEVMVNLTWFLGKGAVTAEITTRLKESVPVNVALTFTSWIEKEKGRLIFTAAEAKTDDGQIMATATAKLMQLD